ncbi:YitT family protein [Desulfotomaculum sp. 1211_IL3151]|uniref:YitT family protein n=1 Tax=Desulfotomaculum sp. 1211_IL3151 TaxID=3084055 RepID=UPI002FD96465
MAFKQEAVNIGKKILGVTAGAVIMAVAFNGLVIPYGLLSGGVGGLALMGNYLLDLPVALGIFFLNIPIFIWGLKELNKKLIIYSLLGTFIMVLALPLTKPYIKAPQIDLFLAAIYSGVVGGFGAGLVFRFGASTGGADIISMVMKKKKNIAIGTFLFYSNIAVLALFIFFFDLKIVMYTALSMWVSGKVTDFVIEGINRNKSVTIISDKSEVIAKRIIVELHRGVTLLDGQGGFSGSSKKVITCVVNNFEIGRLKEIVIRSDEFAFMFVTETAEVTGNGFGGYKS